MLKSIIINLCLLKSITLAHTIKVIYKPMKQSNEYSVRITAYCFNTGRITASGDTIKTNSYDKWVAISPALKCKLKLNYGDSIIIDKPKEVAGTYAIKDLTAIRIRNTIDILTKDKKKINLFKGIFKIKRFNEENNASI